MRVPQVSERIKEAPAQALRGVFAGIGQLLLITDKLRNKTPADTDVPRARTPEASKKATATRPAGLDDQTVVAPAEPARRPSPPPLRPSQLRRSRRSQRRLRPASRLSRSSRLSRLGVAAEPARRRG